MNFMASIDIGGRSSSSDVYGNYNAYSSGSFSITNTRTDTTTTSTVVTLADLDSLGSRESLAPSVVQPLPSRYENQKRRDWNTFSQYLRSHMPPLPLNICSGAQVVEFLRYLDQFGKTKVHSHNCPYFGLLNNPAPCPCPLRQAWGSLDALVGRLRAAYQEHGGKPENNPFGARAVRLFLREVRDYQAKARGVSYEKKRKRPPPKQKAIGMTLPAATS